MPNKGFYIEFALRLPDVYFSILYFGNIRTDFEPSLGASILEYSRIKRHKNTLLKVLTNPLNLITFLGIVALIFLIVVPLIEMAYSTFIVTQRDLRRIPGVEVGDFTWFFWVRVFASAVSSTLLYTPLRNSIVVGLSVSALAVTFGSVMAWLMLRSDLPGKKFFSVALLVPFMLPSWTIALAWMTVFRSGMRGGAPGFLVSLGITVPQSISYGAIPIILVLALSNFAFAYLLVSGALASANSELEEMGEILGAGKLDILRKITFPLVFPAFFSAAILVFARALGSFSVPAFLGMRVDYNTVSTMLFFSIRSRDNATGAVISFVLIAMVALTLYANQKVLGTRKSFATIGGKGHRSNVRSLGKWKIPILVFLVLFCVIGIFFPLIILIVESLLLVPGRYELSNLTLHYWIGGSVASIANGIPGVLRNPWFWQSLRTTMLLTLIVALIGTIVGQILGYSVSRKRGTLVGRVLEQLTFLPFMIPSITFGALYLTMFAQPRFFMPALYGTFALLVLISVVDNLPFSTRAGIANMMQISNELEESAYLAGASFFRRFYKIILPLAKPGFLSGFILIFVGVIRDLDLIILIMTPRMTTLSYMVWWFLDDNYEALANVVATVIFIIVFMVYILAKKIGKVDIAAGLRGGN